jgi:hypothetical protein
VTERFFSCNSWVFSPRWTVAVSPDWLGSAYLAGSLTGLLYGVGVSVLVTVNWYSPLDRFSNW